MPWPKGPRKMLNIDPESPINPYEPQGSSEQETTNGDTDSSQVESPPHFVENKPVFRPFHDRSDIETRYAEYIGLEDGETKRLVATGDSTPSSPPTGADTGDLAKKSPDVVQEQVAESAQPQGEAERPEEATPQQPQPQPGKKYKSIEEAERAAKEAERKMHEATQERARIEAEKRNLEALNRQMVELLKELRGKEGEPKAQPQPPVDELELMTPEEKAELIINDPNRYERLVIERAKREITSELEQKRRAEQEAAARMAQQRAIELFIRMGEQHFENNYQDMKIYEPFVKEEVEKILKGPNARDVVVQKGPQGLIDLAVQNTRNRIEQIKAALVGNAYQPQNTGQSNADEIRTPIPASPVVKPANVITAPPKQEPQIPTPEQALREYVEERNRWRLQRGLG